MKDGKPGLTGNGSENIPFRGEKGHVFEGGIRVPMFAYWKGKILPGQKITEMVTALDLTATSLAAAGGEIPKEFDGLNMISSTEFHHVHIFELVHVFF